MVSDGRYDYIYNPTIISADFNPTVSEDVEIQRHNNYRLIGIYQPFSERNLIKNTYALNQLGQTASQQQKNISLSFQEKNV